MKNLFLILIVVAVLGGGYLLMNGQKSTNNSTMTVSETSTPEAGVSAVDGVKEFTVDGFEFGYDQKTLTVKKGDTVTIKLTNSGKMPHDWVVDEFNAKSKEIKNGEMDSITFVADKAGTFEFYCSVGSHRAMGMVGSLVVQE
jgi:nitrosocyanin